MKFKTFGNHLGKAVFTFKSTLGHAGQDDEAFEEE